MWQENAKQSKTNSFPFEQIDPQKFKIVSISMLQYLFSFEYTEKAGSFSLDEWFYANIFLFKAAICYYRNIY